jgi:hypothetical protein
MKNLEDYAHEAFEPFDSIKYRNENIDYSKAGSQISCASEIKKQDISIAKLIGDINKQEILDKINRYELSTDVKSFSDEYEKLFEERNVFLWKFLGSVFTDTGATLSTVDEKYMNSVTDIKIVFSILCGILDDVADVHKDKKLLQKMTNIVYNRQNLIIDLKDERILLVKKMWDFLTKELEKLPRYKEFKDIFMYDLKQFLNAFEYACLINDNPTMICLHESENYDAHNMMVFIFNGVDLMASPDFDKDELPQIRTAFWHAQKMARIGNWLSTWKRELKQNDLGSGVFTYAITKKIIDHDDVQKLSEEELISKIENSDANEYFLKSWKQNYELLDSLKGKVTSVDINAYVNGLENVIKYHLATEGLK